MAWHGEHTSQARPDAARHIVMVRAAGSLPTPRHPLCRPTLRKLAPGHSPGHRVWDQDRGLRPGAPLRFRRACATLPGFSARIRHEVRYRYPRDHPLSLQGEVRHTRQPGLVSAARARLELLPPYDQPGMCCAASSNSPISGSASVFHQTMDQGWHPTVRPPRLGGNERVGVFATLLHLPPQPLGLSRGRAARVGRERGSWLARGAVDCSTAPRSSTSSPMSPCRQPAPRPWRFRPDALHPAAGGEASAPRPSSSSPWLKAHPELRELVRECWPRIPPCLQEGQAG